jgi:hypothetical protein
MKNKITIVSTIDGLDKLKDLQPQPARELTPDWFKKVPRLFPDQKPYQPGGPVKRCPSFVDWFGTGYVFPMWCDTMLANSELEWAWQTSSEAFIWEKHTAQQYMDFIPSSADVNVVYKAINPWQVITPKGWSCIQMPLYYEYNPEWEVLPGIIHTDTHHEINPQVALKGSKDEISILSGTPLFQLIPFKRESYDTEIFSYQNAPKQIMDKIAKVRMRFLTNFTGGYKKNAKDY